MPNRLDIEDILARNPHLNIEMVNEAKELDQQLREMGLLRKGYDIVAPFGRRRLSAQDDAKLNPRHMRRRRMHGFWQP